MNEHLLVLSLLRLGDLILVSDLLREVKRSRPQTKLTLCLNDEVPAPLFLFPEGTEVIKFPRKFLQNQMTQESHTTLAAFQNLDSWLNSIKTSAFTEVWDFSNTAISAKMMALLEVPKKSGVFLQDSKAIEYQNPWQKYLNEIYATQKESRFQWVDILRKSFQIPFSQKRSLSLRSKNHIGFQIFTSDTKKNWPLVNYQKLFVNLQKYLPQVRLSIIVSPSERKFYTRELDLITKGTDVVICDPGLEELPELLSNLDFLVSSDTSVLHMASLQGIASVAIFLGGANISKTSPRQAGSWIVSTTVPCAPCSHRLDCHQNSHLCAEQISVQDLTNTIVNFATDRKEPMLENRNVRLDEVRQDAAGLYVLRPVMGTSPVQFLHRQICQSTWQIFLDGHHHDTVPPFGSSAYDILRDTSSISNNKESTEAIEFLDRRVQAVVGIDLLLEEMLSHLNHLGKKLLSAGSSNSTGKELDFFKRVEHSLLGNPGYEYLSFFFNCLRDVKNEETAALDFNWFKKSRRSLIDAQELIEIDQKICRTIKNELQHKWGGECLRT